MEKFVLFFWSGLQLVDLFNIKYSEDGSNQKATEGQIVF